MTMKRSELIAHLGSLGDGDPDVYVYVRHNDRDRQYHVESEDIRIEQNAIMLDSIDCTCNAEREWLA